MAEFDPDAAPHAAKLAEAVRKRSTKALRRDMAEFAEKIAMKHPGHDQSSHGNWSRGEFVAGPSVLMRQDAQQAYGIRLSNIQGEAPLTQSDHKRIADLGMEHSYPLTNQDGFSEAIETRSMKPGKDVVLASQPGVQRPRIEQLLSDPTTVGDRNPFAVQAEDGRVVLVDGHHRWVAAAVSGETLNVDVAVGQSATKALRASMKRFADELGIEL